MKLQLALCGLTLLSVVTAAMPPTGQSRFAMQLLQQLASDRTTENLIFSPASIQSCLALALMGAEGSTADELQHGLQLGDGVSKQKVAAHFGSWLNKTQKTSGATLKVANRIYVDQRLNVTPAFQALARAYFASAAEQVNFSTAAPTAAHINEWVEEQTEHKIRDLLRPDALSANTAALLVNAIYFRANWTKYFDAYATEKQQFHVSASQRIDVDMMYQKDTFGYGELHELDAIALEMSYVDSDLKMLLLLPKQLEGLMTLEMRLQQVDLMQLSARLSAQKVRVSLPKFRLEFDVALKQTLQELGMRKLFSSAADFSGIFGTATQQQVAISEVQHKAFIEVNELGTEAAAATYAKFYLLSANLHEKIYNFVADHPFFFAILDQQTVYFMGHVVKP